MYRAEDLTAYPFFHEVLQSTGLSVVLDSLTGVVSRAYILGFIRQMIAHGTPFSLGIIDLDNFKGINDSFGHAMGDEVLSRTADGLIACVGAGGLVGRYGGDEFLLVHFLAVDYDAAHAFYGDMYRRVFRRCVQGGGGAPYVTATAGCAFFPRDALDFDGLFAQVDKLLYRGKTKGRNCYIIFVPEKHRDLDITRLTRRSLYDTLRQATEGFAAGGVAHERICRGFSALRRGLQMSRLLHLNAAGELIDLETQASLGTVGTLSPLGDSGLYSPSDFNELRAVNPRLCQALVSLGLGSALFHRVGGPEDGLGFLVFCPESHNMHIWQDGECAVAYVFCQLTERCWREEKIPFAPVFPA